MKNKDLAPAEITALMTTYNSANYVKETIDTILDQTYQNFVFLILDDGSTDNTVDIIESYDDKRIKLIKKKTNKGVGYRLNQAVRLVETKYIAKVDADDLSRKERFEKQLNYIKENPHLDIIKSLFTYFPDSPQVANSERYKQYKLEKENEHNSINNPKSIAENLPKWLCVIHTTYFAKSCIIKDIGYPNSRYAEDYSLFLKSIKKGYVIGCLNEILVDCRVSNYSTTTHHDTADLYVKQIIKIKKDEIDSLCRMHDNISIYGTGGLAKATFKSLRSKNIKVTHFIDRKEKGSINLGDYEVPVKSINDNISGGIIISAQPVRMEVKILLEEKGLVEWRDFLILA